MLGQKVRASLLCLLLLPVMAGAQVIFEDNFDSGKSGAWRQINDGPTPGSFSLQGGAYRIASAHPVESVPRAIVQNVATTEYFVQADVRITPVSPSFAAASLMMDYLDSTHCYELSLDARNGTWSLGKIDKTGSSPMATGPVSKLRKANRLGLYAREGDIRAFVNGVMVAEQNDNQALPLGGFGLSARGADTLWDNVRVVASNPDVFFYSLTALSTDVSGTVRFPGTAFQLLDPKSHPLPNVTVYRIYKDGLSFFVFQDPGRKFRVTSGFPSDFPDSGGNIRRVLLSRAGGGTAAGDHCYSRDQTSWLLAFVRRSARYSGEDVTVDYQTIRNLYLRGTEFYQQGEPLDPAVLGTPPQRVQLSGLLFGRWEDYGDYQIFPAVEGAVGPPLIPAFARLAGAPQNSKFTLYVMHLATGSGPPVGLSWFVQQDSRAFVYVDSAQFPSQLAPGANYSVPLTIVNTGETAGPFRLYAMLSVNSFMGAKDTRLASITFDGLAAGATESRQITIHVPTDVSSGRYFAGMFLQPQDSKNRILRVYNSTAAIRPVTVGSFPLNGRLEIALSWSAPADLDLHVTDPYGETVYYYHPRTVAGGVLMQDVQCGVGATGQESIQYADGTAAAGPYRVDIHYFRSCGAGQIQWNLLITSDHGSSSYQGSIQPGQYMAAARYTR
jgi:hypothetical protein